MTEQNDSPVNTSVPSTLTPKQSLALAVLTAGGSIVAAAKAAGVTRQTVHNWLAPGHPFASAAIQWKDALAQTCRTRLLMLSDAATLQIARSIKNGDTRAALAIIKGMGLLSPPPASPLSPFAARDRRAATEANLQVSFHDLLNTDQFLQEMQPSEQPEPENKRPDDVAPSDSPVTHEDAGDPEFTKSLTV